MRLVPSSPLDTQTASPAGGAIYNRVILDDNGQSSQPGDAISTYNYALKLSHTAEFFEYLTLQRYSKSHTKQVRTYFQTHFANKSFGSPLELQKYIENHGKAECHLVKTARVYLNYCEKFERLPEAIIEKYRRFLKIRHTNVDVYVPEDAMIQKAYEQVKQDSTLELILLVLATSGIRLIEALDFLKNYDQGRFKQHPGFVSYPVAELRHTKNINNVYLPQFVYEKLRHIDVSYPALRMRYRRHGSVISLKYFRKWHYNSKSLKF